MFKKLRTNLQSEIFYITIFFKFHSFKFQLVIYYVLLTKLNY